MTAEPSGRDEQVTDDITDMMADLGVSDASGATGAGTYADPADNPHALFPGDTSTMDIDARTVAIRLKRDRFITGDLYEMALDHMDEVRQSLNNDLLELVDIPRYRVMYARPVSAEGLAARSLKTKASLHREEAAMLAMLRIRVLGYESSREPSENWMISVDEIRAALTTGAGWLAARNDEEGVMKRISSAITRCTTNGYLAGVEGADDMYRITPLVPAVLTTELAEQWLAESGNGADDDTAGDTDAGSDSDTGRNSDNDNGGEARLS